MGLSDLIKKTLNAEIKRQNGIGHKIVYTHLKTRETVILNCIPEEIVFGEDLKDKANDYVVFHGLDLSIPPSNGDTIIWNGKRYSHEKTITQVNGLYDVKASSKRHTGRGIK
jgi:hypothetical protein